MRTQVMEVSPAVFLEIQEKATEGADSFALWAHETFGCVYRTEYKVVVVWEWGTLRKWAFPQG